MPATPSESSSASQTDSGPCPKDYETSVRPRLILAKSDFDSQLTILKSNTRVRYQLEISYAILKGMASYKRSLCEELNASRGRTGALSEDDFLLVVNESHTPYSIALWRYCINSKSLNNFEEVLSTDLEASAEMAIRRSKPAWLEEFQAQSRRAQVAKSSLEKADSVDRSCRSKN